MAFGAIAPAGMGDLPFLLLTAVVAALASFLVFLGCFWWFRREQRRWQRRVLSSVARAADSSPEIVLARRDAPANSELVAQFKVNRGRQTLSVLEADGRRFIHIEGELSRPERDRLIRYLKSEGFMS